MDNRVLTEMSDGVADVRLIRADKMNALDATVFADGETKRRQPSPVS